MAEPILSVQSVSRAFGGLQALRDVSFAVGQAEIVGIIGPNGAGKSTLFNVVSGFIRPDRGRVLFDGRALEALSPDAVARAGLVKTFQTSRPFASMSFVDNVMIGALGDKGDLGAARREAERCLDLVGLSGFRDAPAKGASTGQRKRLDIARVLAARPRAILLDEPFGGVDVAAIDGLIALIGSIRAAGTTIVVIEHNLEAVRRLVDRLIAMNLGEKIAEGGPAEVTKDARVVRAYLGGEAGHA
ncbi:MAG: ABC transporter ATP-binding protein [Geminicoccales bacterium]